MSFSLSLHFLPVLSLQTSVSSTLKFYPFFSGVIMSIRSFFLLFNNDFIIINNIVFFYSVTERSNVADTTALPTKKRKNVADTTALPTKKRKKESRKQPGKFIYFFVMSIVVFFIISCTWPASQLY